MSAALNTAGDTLTRAERAADKAGDLLTRHRTADSGIYDLLREIEIDATMDVLVEDVTPGSVEALELRHEAMQAAREVYFSMVGRSA